MKSPPTGGSRSAGQRCSLLRRMAAIAYDSIVVVGLLLIATAAASPFDNGNQVALRDLPFTTYLFAVWFFYLALCWIHGGMTVGMRAWKIVLRAEGGTPGWKLCSLRFLVALLSAAAFGLGFLWSLYDSERRCWHDIASKTGLWRIGP